MGSEVRYKQYSRTKFLEQHPVCCYCGDHATTTDHFPPRALFYNKIWPEGFEFPACATCNNQGRLDEQVVSVLAKLWFGREQTATQRNYWGKQVIGLANTQKEISKELFSKASRNEQRRAFRQMFGDRGDALRQAGYGMISIGPLVRASIDRFCVKLAQALFYKHVEAVFDGEIWFTHISTPYVKESMGFLEALLSIAPLQPTVLRSGQYLQEQFDYRYNLSSVEAPLLYAIVQFSNQMIFQIIAASKEFITSAGGELKLKDGTQFPGTHVVVRPLNNATSKPSA